MPQAQPPVPSKPVKPTKSPHSPDSQPTAPKGWRKHLPSLLAGAPFLFLWLWLWQGLLSPNAPTLMPYSELKHHIAQKEVVEASLTDGEVTGFIQPGGGPAPAAAAGSDAWYAPLLPPGLQAPAAAPDSKQKPVYFRSIRVDDPALVQELTDAGVKFSGVRPSVLASVIWSWILPLGLMLFLWTRLSRRFSASSASMLAIGKSRAKVLKDNDTGVSFGDVAGCEEAKHELMEVVDFLKTPARYEALGAKIPEGVLLVGPPGTGKTLLARAVAGEAGVPFFSLSGSDFVEMFVGVGAARVRDLFVEAKKSAPCIVFIDEIDTIGRHRSVHAGAVNDEREQTLNQLLSEMDGFEPNAGVIILGATNRPEVLDRALLRPGRFDRQVVIDAPDLAGREAILKVHARGKPLGAGVDLKRIAQQTPGFSGADLANTMNEAALLAARGNQPEILHKDLEEAIEKVLAGPERKSRRLGPAEKERVAYHEGGHALVAAFCPLADPVHKISIVPRGRAALGYTMQLPDTEQFLLTRGALLDKIRGLLGGRAAEELVYAEVSTGAENDLEKATAIAEQMVCMYGMGRKLGLAHFGEQRPLYLAGGGESLAKNCSPETARQIDEEVQAILADAYRDAKTLLTAHRPQLDRLAAKLVQTETMDGAALQALLAEGPPAVAPVGAVQRIRLTRVHNAPSAHPPAARH